MDISGNGDRTIDCLGKYPEVMEYIHKGLPDPRGGALSNTVYFYYDHTRDNVTCRSVSGAMCFIVSTPLIWSNKRHSSIKTYRYSA